MNIKANRVLDSHYLSVSALPYWLIAAFDFLVIVFSYYLSIYVEFGGVLLVKYAYENARMLLIAAPFFFLIMNLFRTYHGTLSLPSIYLIHRLFLGLVVGGLLFSFICLLFPDGILPPTLTFRCVLLTLIASMVLQWSMRMVARMCFTNYEKKTAYQLLFESNKKGNFEDVTIRPTKRINLCLAHMSEDGMEQKYVKEAFDTNWVVPLGPNVNAFEKDLESFFNLNPEGVDLDKKVVALSAGTAAIHLALRSIGTKPGDEVIVQSFTFCASANPVTYLGAVPVFVDSEPESWNMDPVLLEKAIIDRKAITGEYPKAIIPVSLYGMPYDVDSIMAIAGKYNIPVIEDAAEGFGSCWKGRKLGSFGKFGILSFNGNKMITTSGGGALVCNNDEDRNNIMWFATQAREAYPYYQHEAIGFNYRMSNVCAGIGRGQMTIVNDHIAHHKKVQALYKELLADVPGVKLHEAPTHPDDTKDCKVYDSNFWLCAITLDENLHVKGQENAYKQVITGAVGGAAGVVHAVATATTDCQPNANVEAMRVYLDQKKIEARPVWKPMHKQPVFKGVPAYVNGVSESIFKVGLCLPAGPMVSEADIRYIVDCIKEAIEK